MSDEFKYLEKSIEAGFFSGVMAVIVLCLIFGIVAFLFQWSWNIFIAYVFSVPVLNFWQALGGLLVTRLFVPNLVSIKGRE